MELIATLIAADQLDESMLSVAGDLLRARGLACGAPRWIEPGHACDLPLAGPAPIARRALGELAGVEVAVQPAGRRFKRLMVADMDSTMITVECIDELADYVGLKTEVAEITERAMHGELDFPAALAARVKLLAGLDAAVIDRCRLERVRITPGARTLVRTMRAGGATCILVSGGFTHFADSVGEEIGFQRVVANVLEIAAGRLTGTVRRPIVDAGTKRRELVAAAAGLGIPVAETLAIGDGANDIPMLEAAGLGVAYHAKPAAAAAADVAIRHGDLTSLLYVQGIARDQWVTD